MKKTYTPLLFVFLFTITAHAQLWNINSGPSGIPLHTNIAGAQTEQQLCVTSVRDGIIYVWKDTRTGSNGQDIWAQKYTLCGTPVWAASGVLICNAAANQTVPQIIPDGSDGAIITWQDARGPDNDIYAQRINGAGVVQWVANGIVISATTNNQQVPQIVKDGVGGAIIAWEDNRAGNYDIYAQRVTASGFVQWTVNGVPVCVQTGAQNNLALASDSLSGCLIVWEDGRPTNAGTDIFAQRLSPAGAPLWTVDGIQLSNNSLNQKDPCVAYTLGGTAIFAWGDPFGTGETIKALKLTLLGTAFTGWTMPNGNVAGNAITESGNPGTALRPKIAADKLGGCYISYRSNYSSGDKDILTSWMNSNGTPNTCVGSCISNVEITAFSTNVEDNHDITADGCGGAVNTFENRNGPTFVGFRKYGGTSQIASNNVSGASDNPFITALCGVEYLVWQDARTGTLGGDDLYIGGTSNNAPPALLNSSVTPSLSTSSCCNPPMNASVCFGTNIFFSCPLPAGLFNTFTFYDGVTVVQTGSSNIFSTAALTVGTHTITVVSSTASGCATNSSNTINITVLALPTVTATTTTSPICAGSSGILSASGAVSYVWNPGNLSGSTVTVNPTVTTTYTVTGTDANGCTNTGTVTITVNPLPNVTMSVQSNVTCINWTTDVLTGSPTGGTFSGTAVTGTNFNPSVAGIGTFTITYTFTDVNGCTDSAGTQIVVNACTGIGENGTAPMFELFPNPFSNDITVTLSQLDSYSVEITNLLGETVYNSGIQAQQSVIHLSELDAGIYFIKISSASGFTTKRIVKE